MLQGFSGKHVKALIVWEPVLATDWGAPSTAALKRIHDGRARQFWDKERLLSHALGEHDRKSIVWDSVSIYPAGANWDQSLPPAAYRDGAVDRVIDSTKAAITQALQAR
jgi:hypothetical protein